jgi:hypothetical protein
MFSGVFNIKLPPMSESMMEGLDITYFGEM